MERDLIRRLYESDASGRLDQELLDEVFFGFLARCRSIIVATEAALGRVQCPGCTQLVLRPGPDRDALLRCEHCGWQATWREYHDTFRGKQLVGGNAIGAFQEFVRRAPTTASPRERMLLVDWLVHEVHKSIVDGQEEYWRPAALNLIEGRIAQVTAFLDGLAHGAGSTPEVRTSGELWRQRIRPRLRNVRNTGETREGT
jgi:hypothetical protein